MLIKRWLILFMVSMTLTSLALAMGLAWLYRTFDFPTPTQDVVRALTLQFVPHPAREVLILVVGVSLLCYSFWRVSRALIVPLMATSSSNRDLANIVAEHRFGPSRPDLNVVTIGGGTGLSTLLRGLKHHNVGITAIVTVADDGGSTGRIREEFNMPAPGDIRSCIVALADAESTVGRLFQHRFEQAGSPLHGHSFGNLFITALTQVTGSFEQAVIESGRVLAVRGRVLPSTLENVTLCAELIDGSVVRGESTISHRQAPIKRVYLDPDTPDGYDHALTAIINADLIVLGPGSLYTSVLPNLMVGGIAQAIRWSKGTVVYVCNVATQPGETDHFGAADHVRAIVDHIGSDVLHHVLVNSNPAASSAISPDLGVEAVLADGLEPLARRTGFDVVARDVVNDHNPLRHDPEKLAVALLDIARGMAGPRPEVNVRASTTEPMYPSVPAGIGVGVTSSDSHP